MINKKPFLIIAGILIVLIFVFLLIGTKKVIICPEKIEYNGDIYTIIQIGNQCWFAENLRTKQYTDGGDILKINDEMDWGNTQEGAFVAILMPKEEVVEFQAVIDVSTCAGDEEKTVQYIEEEESKQYFGYLYNRYAVNSSSSLCPEGWSIPTHDDWTNLERSICFSDTCEADFPYDVVTIGTRGTHEGSVVAGREEFWGDGQLKESDYFGVSNFNAFPSGYMDVLGLSNQRHSAYFWSLPDNDNGVWTREIHSDSMGITRQYLDSFYGGMSVRCVKDGGISFRENPISYITNYFSKPGINVSKVTKEVDEQQEDDFFYQKLEDSEITKTCPESIIDDRDGQKYAVVQIGNQCWMQENLNYQSEEALCPSERNLYGCYYSQNFTENICPQGWVVPSDNDWKMLEIQLGMSLEDVNQDVHKESWRYTGDVGIKLKLENAWEDTMMGYDDIYNLSGFSALSSGYANQEYIDLDEVERRRGMIEESPAIPADVPPSLDPSDWDMGYKTIRIDESEQVQTQEGALENELFSDLEQRIILEELGKSAYFLSSDRFKRIFNYGGESVGKFVRRLDYNTHGVSREFLDCGNYYSVRCIQE